MAKQRRVAEELCHRYLRDYDRLPPEERFEAIIWTLAKAAVLTADGIPPPKQFTRTMEDIYATISMWRRWTTGGQAPSCASCLRRDS